MTRRLLLRESNLQCSEIDSGSNSSYCHYRYVTTRNRQKLCQNLPRDFSSSPMISSDLKRFCANTGWVSTECPFGTIDFCPPFVHFCRYLPLRNGRETTENLAGDFSSSPVISSDLKRFCANTGWVSTECPFGTIDFCPSFVHFCRYEPLRPRGRGGWRVENGVLEN